MFQNKDAFDDRVNGLLPSLGLTPPSPDNNFDDEDLYNEEPEPGDTPEYSDTTTTTEGPEEPPPEEPPAESIYPILFDRQNRDSRYLASVLGDALIKGLTQVAHRRPQDPIGYLATYLYQYAAKNSRERLPVETDESKNFEDDWAKDAEPATEAPPQDTANGRSTSVSKNPLGVLEEDPEEYDDDEEVTLEFEDHTKMKDEEGQTVLHFAASRVHPDGSFYGLLSHAEVLLAERDSRYRTCRDVADSFGQEDNVAAIDRFVLDAYLKQRSALVQMLLHEGYDHLLHVRDPATDRDVSTVLQQKKMPAAIQLLREVADFTKKREDLHAYIRNSYLEGVCRLIKFDSTLVTAKSFRARCALHIAVLFEHIDIITALVRCNSSAVHVPDNLGRTPLHYAMATKKVEKIAKILVKAGALRSTKDVKMRTPSYFFIYNEEIQSIYEEEHRLA